MKILVLNDYIEPELDFTLRDCEILRELGYDVEYFQISQKEFFKPKNLLNVYKKAKNSDILFSWWAKTFTTVLLSKITGTPSVILCCELGKRGLDRICNFTKEKRKQKLKKIMEEQII